MANLQETIELTKQWFHDKGIIEHSNIMKQLEKSQEELDETKEAASMLHCVSTMEDNPWRGLQIPQYTADLKDGIGDTIVTLIGVCEMAGTSIEECLGIAYDVISKRTGKIVDGVWKKDQ